jgi:hypothetical protein
MGNETGISMAQCLESYARKLRAGTKPQRILDDLEETVEEWREDFPPDDGED